MFRRACVNISEVQTTKSEWNPRYNLCKLTSKYIDYARDTLVTILKQLQECDGVWWTILRKSPRRNLKSIVLTRCVLLHNFPRQCQSIAVQKAHTAHDKSKSLDSLRTSAR